MLRLTPAELEKLRSIRSHALRRALNVLSHTGQLSSTAPSLLRLEVIPEDDRPHFIAAVDRIRRANTDPPWQYLLKCAATARKNAGRRGLEYSLTKGDLLEIYLRADGRCEVSGMPFSMHSFGRNRSPFSPSIDRISNSIGYTLSNVRLVCQIANLAMNVWGDAALHEFLREAKPRKFSGVISGAEDTI